ncbi:MAG: MATE family efflux transporter [Polyangiaceae bacterium]|nr:MATE family efflux transporter [Polyangiaceae bacterium]
MVPPGHSQPFGRRELLVLREAWPYILAGCTTPLLSMVDTALLGHWGSEEELGGIALGGLVFSFLLWSFGFLRMSTTGYVAQASGAQNWSLVSLLLKRSLALALTIASIILALQEPILRGATSVFDAPVEIIGPLGEYYEGRIWGTPAALCGYAIQGCLIGLGARRGVLWLSLFLNGMNVLFDLFFILGLEWGARGLGWGTAIAQWASLLFGVWLVRHELIKRLPEGFFAEWAEVFHWREISRLLRTNFHLLVRTWTLILAFTIFGRQGAAYGSATLAANHILLQYVSFSAFFLDGFAYVAETRLGQAVGRGQRSEVYLAAIVTSRVAALTACFLGGALLLLHQPAILVLTGLSDVVEIAETYLPFAALYISLSWGAFQLDGIFIGATAHRDLSIAALQSISVYLVAVILLRSAGNAGLWCAFILYVIARAVALLIRYRQMIASVFSLND